MSEPTAAESAREEELLNARVGYQTAIMLWTYEGQRIWREFNAMLVANSIVTAVIGLAAQRPEVVPTTRLQLIPIAGLFLCVLWFLLMKRGFANHSYWIHAARELEEKHLAPTVTTTSRRDAWAAGKEVTVVLGGKPVVLRPSFLSRHISPEIVTYLVIAVFAVLNVFFLIVSRYGPSA